MADLCPFSSKSKKPGTVSHIEAVTVPVLRQLWQTIINVDCFVSVPPAQKDGDEGRKCFRRARLTGYGALPRNVGPCIKLRPARIVVNRRKASIPSFQIVSMSGAVIGTSTVAVRTAPSLGAGHVRYSQKPPVQAGHL